jgi:glutaredoxin
MVDDGQTALARHGLAGATPARVRIVLIAVLLAVFAALQLRAAALAPQDAAVRGWEGDGQLHVFFQPDCPHCHRAIEFLKTQPDIAYDLHDVTTVAGERLLAAVVEELAISETNLGVPLFVYGHRHLIGFDSAGTTGRELRDLVTKSESAAPRAMPKSIRLPIFGEIDPSSYSLFALTAVMALADGFNPCAMWVLIYLISLIAGLQEREKIWWLVGTFVLASGILYFLFMTAWLNTFLLIGYVRPLTQFIALAAIGFGIDHLYDLVWNRGVIACEVGDVEQRQRTILRIRDIVTAPIGVASLALVIGLAFALNSVEFLCSAAIPAMYTHMLALMDLSSAAYYGYIALYVLFFMLDDLVIFGLAAFAVQGVLDTRYAAFSRGAGGVVLLGLGMWMLMRAA